MATTDGKNDMSRFDRALQELRDERPTEGMARVREALETGRRRPRRGLILIAGAAGFGAVLLTMRTPAEASLREQVAQAVSGVERSHTRWYDLAGGKDGGLAMEQWLEGAKVRNDFYRQGAPFIRHAYDGKRRWSHLPDRKYVSVATVGGFGPNATPTVAELAESIVRNHPDRQVEVRRTTVDGRPMIELLESYVAHHSGIVGKIVWFADPEDKRPREVHSYRKSGDEWVLYRRGRIDYPNDVDDRLFALYPAEGETLFDKDDERTMLKERWARGLGSVTVGGQTITLRDVAVDRHQCLAVVWTGGGRPAPSAKIFARDAEGRGAVGVPFASYTTSKNNRVPESRFLKIQGKPHRAVFMYGVPTPMVAPLTLKIPVFDTHGKRHGVAEFSVSSIRRTDRLSDYPAELRTDIGPR